MPKPSTALPPAPPENGNGNGDHPGAYLFTERERELVIRRRAEADAAQHLYQATLVTIAELNQLSGEIRVMPSMAGLILVPPKQEEAK